MNVLGIVAEYNPFHNGHQYHIQQTKAIQSFDGIIAIMSGNFSQRGEAAIFDKWIRAEMALSCGVDLVLELPTTFAVRSANYFAKGAILSLAATGIVSHISCGVESTDIESLLHLSEFLSNPPANFRTSLQTQLKQGLSYPAARQKALQQSHLLGTEQIQTPNNILALEYLQILKQEHLSIQPIFISRSGDYHNDRIPPISQGFASASAIRKCLLQEDSLWQNQVPISVQKIIHQQLQQGILPMHKEHFAPILFALLRRSTPEELTKIIEVTEGLENRIFSAAHQTNTLEDLCAAIKSKRYPYTRIQRFLVHLLLHFTIEDSFSEPMYLRVLGFTATGQRLLKEMRKKAQLPILIRPARQRQILSVPAQQMFALDCRATNLYGLGYPLPELWKANQDLIRQPIQV